MGYTYYIVKDGQYHFGWGGLEGTTPLFSPNRGGLMTTSFKSRFKAVEFLGRYPVELAGCQIEAVLGA